jgi:glycosyltransferase involved in cell wall biosynthesis
MKVLQLGPYPPPHGGVQTNLVAIRELLLRQNVPCAVINITSHRKAETDEVYYPKTALQLLRRMRSLRCDIVHLHIGGNVTSRLLGLAFACCSMPGSKAVLTFHSGGYPSSPAGQRMGRSSFAGFVFRRFDRIIAVNQQIVEFFCLLGVPREKIALIYPHPLPSVGESTPPLSAELQQFYESHDPLLISVGLLEPEYDLPLQIEAVGHIRKKFPSAGLVLIGSGSLETALREQIAATKYGDHVLLCGDVPHGVTLRAIAESDLMLRTTLYDGDAVSVREAIHLGLPVIASDNRMRPAGVHLIPAQNLMALLAKVGELLNSPAAKTPDSAEADNIQAVLDIYEQLINTPT